MAQGPASKKKLFESVCFMFGISEIIIRSNFGQKYEIKLAIFNLLKSNVHENKSNTDFFIYGINF
jgi:hypothetical protein